ncbi:hypothetical protein [Haladaptatus sp. DFWS20]|uniref:hypothetical protein n=1 Tax=Haladaptatus sp. DFWS20 TaxID=3403467 RepID=UPI003EBC3BAB
MAFVEPFDEMDTTHRIVTRQSSDVKDWDETGQLTVENRVVDSVLGYGDAIHLSVNAGKFDRTETKLERVDESRKIFAGSKPEYRAVLPRDGDIVRSALAVTPGNTDEWSNRLFTLNEFAIISEDDRLYRSVPHHGHIREVDASGRISHRSNSNGFGEFVPSRNE